MQNVTQMAFKLLRILFFFEKSHQKPNSKKQKYLIQYSVARRGRGGAIAPPPPHLPKCTKTTSSFLHFQVNHFCDMNSKVI